MRREPEFPYVVVENQGTDFEEIVGEFKTAKEAYSHVKQYDEDDRFADVLKRLPGGELTTEI